jgi:hypothetical protein
MKGGSSADIVSENDSIIRRQRGSDERATGFPHEHFRLRLSAK